MSFRNRRNYDFIYVGSFSPTSLINSSVSEGRRGIDFATNNYQRNLVDSFALADLTFYSIVSPFFSSVSNYILRFPKNNSRHTTFLPFTSLSILRNLLEFISIFFLLVAKFTGFRGPFVVFSLHSSFLFSVFLFKLITFNNSPICVVLDDLPSHMFSSSNSFIRLFKSFDFYFLKFLSNYVSHFILLSSHMESLDETHSKSSFVLEGFCSSNISDSKTIPTHLSTILEAPINYFIYAGNLSPSKGVIDLISAFDQFQHKTSSFDTYLLLTGSASVSEMDYLNSLVSRKSNIVLLPSLSNTDLSQLLNSALASVVPTSPTEPFSRFFFPSKLLHYMSHTSPVICLRLPCISEEYFNYTISPSRSCLMPTVDQLASLLVSTYSMDHSERSLLASQSKKFVSLRKSSRFWSSLLSDFFTSSHFLNYPA